MPASAGLQQEASELAALKERFRSFINNEVIPQEPLLDQGGGAADQAMAALKARAKELGLWALGHPAEIGGGDLPFMSFVYMNEIIGRSHYGQQAVGSLSMQDSIMLHRYGTEAQKEQWLKPLVEGDIYPSVGLTEPEVAGSDPTLMRTTARLEGDEWVINGHKWFISGATGASFAILIARTEDDPEAFAQLVGRWQKPIQNLCARMTGDAHRGEDLAQDTFARLFARRRWIQSSVDR